jgi:hypothetical protein
MMDKGNNIYHGDLGKGRNQGGGEVPLNAKKHSLAMCLLSTLP